MNSQPLIILLLLAAYIFSPTLIGWMMDPEGAWYRPFIVWLAVVVIAYFVQGRKRPLQSLD